MSPSDEIGDNEARSEEKREALGYHGLMRAARRAAKESGARQVDLADEFDVTQGGLSRALSTPGPKFARLQQRVIEHLTPYAVEKEVQFILRSKPDTEG